MRQSGDHTSETALSPDLFREIARAAVRQLNVAHAREEVLPLLVDRRSVEIWSADFFDSVIDKVELV